MTRIISVGSATQQIFLQPEASTLVQTDHQAVFELAASATTNSKSLHYGTGGGGLNAAVTFARQGFDSALVATIGQDSAGQTVLQALDQENVDTQYMSQSPRFRTGCTIFLLAEAKRTAISYRGASIHYQLSDISLARSKADWVYVASLGGNMSLLDDLFQQVRAAHLKLAFNPGSHELQQPEKLKSLLEDVAVLIVNKTEARQLAEGQSLEEVARHLLHYVPLVVVTDGPNGSVATTKDQLVRAGLYDDIDVADRTGAGDAFGAGFLSRYIQGDSLAEAIQFASANATAVLRVVGTKRGLLPHGATLHPMPIEERSW